MPVPNPFRNSCLPAKEGPIYAQTRGFSRIMGEPCQNRDRFAWRQGLEQVPGCSPETGMQPIRGDFREWREHKTPFVQARMGQQRGVLVVKPHPVRQKVQIQGSSGISGAPLATELSFNLMEG